MPPTKKRNIVQQPSDPKHIIYCVAVYGKGQGLQITNSLQKSVFIYIDKLAPVPSMGLDSKSYSVFCRSFSGREREKIYFLLKNKTTCYENQVCYKHPHPRTPPPPPLNAKVIFQKGDFEMKVKWTLDLIKDIYR